MLVQTKDRAAHADGKWTRVRDSEKSEREKYEMNDYVRC